MLFRNLSEREFLIRALVGVFALQFLTVGYQTYSCQVASSKVKESERVALICNNASNSFNETGKLALATFLALLVPSSSQTTSQTASRRRRKIEEKVDTSVPLSDTESDFGNQSNG